MGGRNGTLYGRCEGLLEERTSKKRGDNLKESLLGKLEKVLALLDDVVVELDKEKSASPEHTKVLEAWGILDSITNPEDK